MPAPELRQQNRETDLSAEILSADRKGFILVSLPKWAAWAIIAWQMRLSIETLAGKYAFPSLLTRFWRQASVWEVVCWGTALLGLALGLHSRYLLRKQSERLKARMDSIDRRLDAIGALSGNSKSVEGRSDT